MPKKPSAKKRSTMLLLGLGILLFSGYAITLRGRSLAPRKAVHLLGESNLRSGEVAAFRVVGWDLKREQPLRLSRIELKLLRKPNLSANLIRKLPAHPVAHLNVRLPDWPAGPAVLRAEIESGLGPLVLESQVVLNPLWETRLRLVPPQRELSSKPVLIREGAGQGREPVPVEQSRAPARFDFYPHGGRLSSSWSTGLLVRVVDGLGRPVTGELQLDDKKPKDLDPDGFVETVVTEGRMPRRIRLAFTGETGWLAGDVSLIGQATQVDLAVDRILLRAGTDLGLHLRALSAAQTAYLEAWWNGGWCHSSQIELSEGRASSQLVLPLDVTGPVLIRVRGDPFGLGQSSRKQAVVVGAKGVPTGAEALSLVRGLPADPGFWEEAGSLSAQDRSLQAILSRIQAGEGALPELADGSEEEKAQVAQRKSDLQAFGLGLSGVVSLLAWLVTAWFLFGLVLRTRADPLARKRAWRTALLGVFVVTLALGGGWFWLYWGS